ncbi:DUF485 domain-containing protein [Actinomadura harenae]|nr:DUF485 domain-containing protein [Actinomadura harenae]
MARDERFLLLRRRFSRLAAAVAGSFLGWYFLYVALSAFARDLMARPVVGNINVALILGVLQFLSTFALAWYYARYATASLDPIAAALKEEADAPAAIRGPRRSALHSPAVVEDGPAPDAEPVPALASLPSPAPVPEPEGAAADESVEAPVAEPPVEPKPPQASAKPEKKPDEAPQGDPGTVPGAPGSAEGKADPVLVPAQVETDTAASSPNGASAGTKGTEPAPSANGAGSAKGASGVNGVNGAAPVPAANGAGPAPGPAKNGTGPVPGPAKPKDDGPGAKSGTGARPDPGWLR